MEVIFRTVQGEAPSLDSYSEAYRSNPSSAFENFIDCVLKKDPEHRYTTEKVLGHRWLALAEQGREELLLLFQKIPDLEGMPDCDMEVPVYVNGS